MKVGNTKIRMKKYDKYQVWATFFTFLSWAPATVTGLPRYKTLTKIEVLVTIVNG